MGPSETDEEVDATSSAPADAAGTAAEETAAAESGTEAEAKGSRVADEFPGFVVSWPGEDGELEEGPLGVLWQLIESYRVDIFDVSLMRITEDFIAFLTSGEELRLDLASSFSVMAARLLYYKSRALLPDPGFEEPDDEPRLPPELVQQLLEYRKFQQAADRLKSIESITAGMFRRETGLTPDVESDGSEWLDLDMSDIVHAYQAVLDRFGQIKPGEAEYEIGLDEYSVEDKIDQIRGLLKNAVSFSFQDLFENLESMTRGEIVVTFLAILELVKQSDIIIRQQAKFGDIVIFRKQDVVS